MKEVTREITKVEKFTVYEAVDGITFNSKEECKKYEESALCVVRSRIKELTTCKPRDAWTTLGGLDDHSVIAVKPVTEDDVHIILQWLFLEQPHYLKDSMEARREQVRAIVQRAWMDKDVILMGINCEGEYYFINSRRNIIDNLMAMDRKEEGK